MPDWLTKILERPTASVPDTGRALGLSRNAAYDAAKRGEIHTLEFGRRKRVPTAWLRKKLMIEDARE